MFVSYKGNNLYGIYHLFTRKIHRTRDIDKDESLLYDKSEINPWDFANAKWKNSDDSFIADLLEFDDEELETNARSAPIASEEKSIELLKLGTRGNDVRSWDQKENQSFNNNHSNTKLALILVSKTIDSIL